MRIVCSDVATGFCRVTNNGKEDDRLIKATVTIMPKVQLHTMKMEGDVTKVEELPDGIAIPAGQTVELKPASFQVLFMDLKHALVEGEEIKGTSCLRRPERSTSTTKSWPQATR